jgi:hypothetical protein
MTPTHTCPFPTTCRFSNTIGNSLQISISSSQHTKQLSIHLRNIVIDVNLITFAVRKQTN